MWNVCLDFHMLSLLLLTYSENFIEMLGKYLQLKQQQKQQRHLVMTKSNTAKGVENRKHWIQQVNKRNKNWVVNVTKFIKMNYIHINCYISERSAHKSA